MPIKGQYATSPITTTTRTTTTRTTTTTTTASTTTSGFFPNPPSVETVLQGYYKPRALTTPVPPPAIIATTPQIVLIQDTPYAETVHYKHPLPPPPPLPQVITHQHLPTYHPVPVQPVYVHPSPVTPKPVTPKPVYHHPSPVTPKPVYVHPSPVTPKPVYHHPKPTKPHYHHQNDHHHHHQNDHHHAYHPVVVTKKPESPRFYFPAPDIPGLLQDEDATTLLDLLEQADLVSALSGEGPFTLFAPTNEAFSKLDPNLVRALTADTDLLKSVLLYHVVPGTKKSVSFANDQLLDTLLQDDKTSSENATQKLRLTIDKDKHIININGAQVLMDLADQEAKVSMI